MTPAELRQQAKYAESIGRSIRAEVLYREADRLEAEQAAARSASVSSGGSRGSLPPDAPMPSTFLPPQTATAVGLTPPTAPAEELAQVSFEDVRPQPTRALIEQLTPRETGDIYTQGIGSQQVFVDTVPGTEQDFSGLLGDVPYTRPPGLLGLNPRFDYYEQYTKAQAAIDRYISERTRQLVGVVGLAPSEARKQAEREASDRFRRIRVDAQGAKTTTGEGGLLPFPPFRETRLYKTPAVDDQGNPILDESGFPVMTQVYRDPETGDMRPPTDFERVFESYGRQRIDLDQTALNRAERAASYQKMMADARDRGFLVLSPEEQERVETAVFNNLEPIVKGYLHSVDRESGQITETAAGAALRGLASFPAAANEALMEYTPLFWEQDPATGEPVDPDSLAYRIHKFNRDYYESQGLSPAEIDNLTTGPVGLMKDGSFRQDAGVDVPVLQEMALASYLPKLFQPIQRRQPTPVDPTGRRAVPDDASFPGRVAAAIQTARSLGDDMMSMPAMRGETVGLMAPGMGVLAESDMVYLSNEASTYPYWFGLAGEMIYPVFPLIRGGTLLARGGSKVAGASAKAVGTGARLKRAQYLADVPAEVRPFLYPEAGLVEGALEGVERAAKATEKAAYVAGHPVQAARRARLLRAAQDVTEGRLQPVNDLDVLKDLHSVRRVTGEATAGEILSPYALQSVLNASDEPVTVGRLLDVVADSPVGRHLLDEAGLLGRPITATVSIGEQEKLRAAIARINTAALRKTLTNIADDLDLPVEEQARNILSQMHAAGIETRHFPEARILRQIADGADATPVKAVLDDMFIGIPTRVQRGPERPIVESLHEMGNQLQRQAQSDEVRRITGETGRIMARRLGETPVNRSTIANQSQEIVLAAKAAGGRLVEASLEDVVPDDLVFVTKTLMAPASKVTDDVFEEVATRMGPFQPVARVGAADDAVDGLRPVLFDFPEATTEEFIRAVGVDNIRQSRGYTEITGRLRNGESLTAAQADVVQEAISTRMFEQVLGRYAAPLMASPARQPRQFDLASQPRVNVGLETDRAKAVPRAPVAAFESGRFSSPLMQDASMVLAEGGGRQLAQVLRKAGKASTKEAKEAVFTVAPEAAPGIRTMQQKLTDEFGAISDNVRKEIRDTALRPEFKGNPEGAFNTVVRRRLDRLNQDMQLAIQRRAQELADSLNMTEKEAMFNIAYRRGAGQEVAGIGESVRDIPQDMGRILMEREEAMIRKRAWEDVLRNFFGKDLYELHIGSRGLLDDYIKVGPYRKTGRFVESPAEIEPLTTAGVRDVVQKIREADQALEGIGAAVGRTPITARDAIVPVLKSWIISTDKELAARNAYRALKDQHPQVAADLLPSMYSQIPARTFREASTPLTIRRNMLGALTRLGAGRGATAAQKADAMAKLQARPEYGDFLKRAVDESGRYVSGAKGTYQMQDTGEFVNQLDNLSRNALINLDPAARQDLVEQVMTKMLSTGLPVIDYRTLLRSWDESPNLSIKAFQKQYATSELGKIIAEMDRRVLQAGPAGVPFESGADALLYQALQGARAAGYDDTFIVQMLRQSLLESTFNTTIAPIVDEVTANARAMGIRPQLGKGAITNAVSLTRSLDPYDDAVMVLGPDMTEMVENLKKSAISGQLADNLEQLRRRDQYVQAARGKDAYSIARYALSLIADASTMSRRVVGGGMLGAGVYVGVTNIAGQEVPLAIPMPNTRYIGMNALTAPIIALTTVGMNNAIKSYGRTTGFRGQGRDVARQLSTIVNRPLVDAVSSRPPSTVVFKTDAGRDVTYGQLRTMIERNNLGSSRGQVEFTDALVRDALRDARLMADGLPTPEFRQFARQFDPSRTNIAQYFANATDKALRENLFASAIQRGMTEAQAANLARNVVLDYGAIPATVKNTVNRHVLFASFRMANYTATLNALARDPDMFVKMVRAQQVNQQRTDAWLMGPDHMKSRTLFGKEYVFDGDAGAGQFGPTLPPIDAMVDGARLASFIANMTAEDNDAWGRAGDTMREENLVPWLVLGMNSYFDPARQTGRPRRVPNDIINWSMQNSPDRFWPYIKKRYNIVPVAPSERLRGRPSAIDPQRPELGPNEYKFGSFNDQLRFQADMTILQYMTIKRTTTDYTNLGLKYDPSDYLQIKRTGLAPTYGLLFGAGASTPLSMRSMEQMSREALRRATKAAQAQTPKPE